MIEANAVGGYIIPKHLAAMLTRMQNAGLVAIIGGGEQTKMIFDECTVIAPKSGFPHWEWSDTKLTLDERRFYGLTEN